MFTVSTKKFSYDSTDKTFVSELSMFNGCNLFSRVYPDACDEGFTLVSHKTGKEIDFVIDEEKYDNEGDLLFIHLVPVPDRKSSKGYENLSIILFND